MLKPNRIRTQLSCTSDHKPPHRTQPLDRRRMRHMDASAYVVSFKTRTLSHNLTPHLARPHEIPPPTISTHNDSPGRHRNGLPKPPQQSQRIDANDTCRSTNSHQVSRSHELFKSHRRFRITDPLRHTNPFPDSVLDPPNHPQTHRFPHACRFTQMSSHFQTHPFQKTCTYVQMFTNAQMTPDAQTSADPTINKLTPLVHNPP